jgi:hypothetical protein
VYYLETADPVAQPFLHGVNTRRSMYLLMNIFIYFLKQDAAKSGTEEIA